MSGPLIKRSGEVSDDLIHITDWMPTLIHLAGGNTSHIDLDGINQWNTLTTGEPTKREVRVHNSELVLIFGCY